MVAFLFPPCDSAVGRWFVNLLLRAGSSKRKKLLILSDRHRPVAEDAHRRLMRKSRYQQGSVRKQRGRWMGMWWVDGKRKSRTIGLIKDMTKSEAREVVADIVERLQAERSADRIWRFGEFVNEVYFPFYARKWKRSTRDNNVNRVLVHLVSVFKNRNVASLRREELQDLLDAKAKALSFSVVDRLRWDLKQVFDMAIAEGIVERNPALLLFTPKEAKK